jgi:hypothetical protein
MRAPATDMHWPARSQTMRRISHHALKARSQSDISVGWYAVPVLGAALIGAVTLFAGSVRFTTESAYASTKPQARSHASSVPALATASETLPQVAVQAASNK